MNAELPSVPTTGQLVVVTESGSRYLIDLDLQRLCRKPRTETPVDVDVDSVDLRRDHEWIHILMIERLEVGERAEFVLEPLGNPRSTIFTRRSTTPVVSIQRQEAVATAPSEPKVGTAVAKIAPTDNSRPRLEWHLAAHREPLNDLGEIIPLFRSVDTGEDWAFIVIEVMPDDPRADSRFAQVTGTREGLVVEVGFGPETHLVVPRGAATHPWRPIGSYGYLAAEAELHNPYMANHIAVDWLLHATVDSRFELRQTRDRGATRLIDTWTKEDM